MSPASLAGPLAARSTQFGGESRSLRRPMGTWPSPTAPIDELAFTFVDVETTGLDHATGDRVCEIALLRVHGDQELARFESLVHPQRLMTAGATAVNGITDAML